MMALSQPWLRPSSDDDYSLRSVLRNEAHGQLACSCLLGSSPESNKKSSPFWNEISFKAKVSELTTGFFSVSAGQRAKLSCFPPYWGQLAACLLSGSADSSFIHCCTIWRLLFHFHKILLFLVNSGFPCCRPVSLALLRTKQPSRYSGPMTGANSDPIPDTALLLCFIVTLSYLESKLESKLDMQWFQPVDYLFQAYHREHYTA